MRLQLTPDEQARFWSFVDQSGECWLWTGTPSQRYGLLGFRGRVQTAHRLSYEMHVGPVTEGLYVCHRCNVKRCVRPGHLYLGTAKDNAQDAAHDGLYPTGEQHWSRRYPERLRRGERNGSHTHPERRPRGDRNGARIHPETHVRGERHALAKLTPEHVLEIRRRWKAGGVLQRELAAEFGVDQTLISGIVRGRNWPHLSL